MTCRQSSARHPDIKRGHHIAPIPVGSHGRDAFALGERQARPIAKRQAAVAGDRTQVAGALRETLVEIANDNAKSDN
jgi:hypothetical protein